MPCQMQTRWADLLTERHAIASFPPVVAWRLTVDHPSDHPGQMRPALPMVPAGAPAAAAVNVKVRHEQRGPLGLPADRLQGRTHNLTLIALRTCREHLAGITCTFHDKIHKAC